MDKPINFEEKKQDILNALNTNMPADMKTAEPDGFTLIEGFVSQPINKAISGAFIIGGPSIPMVAVVGNTTGRMYYFALKKLLPDLQF